MAGSHISLQSLPPLNLPSDKRDQMPQTIENFEDDAAAAFGPLDPPYSDFGYFDDGSLTPIPYRVEQNYSTYFVPHIDPSNFYSFSNNLQFDAAMASFQPQDDMSEFQKLSNEYEPDLQGPLVGLKQPIQDLATEYAQADPVYIAKTTELAQQHSEYRVMKGDGNCGWRAVAFGYFENLLRLRDPAMVAQELARIKGFNSLLDSVGQEEHLYEIFVDATEELLNNILEAIQKGNQDDTFLLDAFNLEYNSSAIITHFRLLTSAWMKLNPDRYQAFLPIPLDQYCATTIETVKTEIDQIGLQALVDCIIHGSGFALEVVYLDRSDGALDPYCFTPKENTAGTIRLLYRPGHYDILYPVVYQVNYHTNMFPTYVPQDLDTVDTNLDSELMQIPGITHDCRNDPSPPPGQDSVYVVDVHHTWQTPPQPTAMHYQNFPGLPSLPVPRETDQSSELPIRINPFACKPMKSLPLSSVSFRNSHSNQAHFRNSDFQPSQWDPREGYRRNS